MTTQSKIMPDPRFEELGTLLANRLARAAAEGCAESTETLFDPLMRKTLRQGFTEARAHEGTIWLLDETGKFLVPVYNTGPNASRLVGQFRQPLSSGLICMVFACEQPFLENEVYRSTLQSKLLDATLGVQTCALIAVPFYFVKACRGVISCVQLRLAAEVSDPPGFSAENLGTVQRVAAVLSRLVEFRLICQTIGWSAA